MWKWVLWQVQMLPVNFPAPHNTHKFDEQAKLKLINWWSKTFRGGLVGIGVECLGLADCFNAPLYRMYVF